MKWEYRTHTSTGRKKTPPEMADQMYARFKYTCKCGTKTIIPNQEDKKICRGCGHWVYRDPKQEFKERLEGELKKWKKKQ